MPVPITGPQGQWGGGWWAASATGPPSSEAPDGGGLVAWCSVQCSAGGKGFAGQHPPPSHLRKKETPFAALCVHLGKVVSVWLGAWLKMVWDRSCIRLAWKPSIFSAGVLRSNLLQGRIRHQCGSSQREVKAKDLVGGNEGEGEGRFDFTTPGPRVVREKTTQDQVLLSR